MDNTLATCPVCTGRISRAMLSTHMSGHSKDEIVSALLQQQTAAPANPLESMGIHFLAAGARQPRAANVVPTAFPMTNATPTTAMLPATSTSSVPQILMPQMPGMMGMMPVMSPCLVPQPNGPPLLINMTSYVYPNMLGGMIGPTAGNLNHGGLLTPGMIPTFASGSIASGSSPTVPVQQPTVVLPTVPVTTMSYAASLSTETSPSRASVSNTTCVATAASLSTAASPLRASATRIEEEAGQPVLVQEDSSDSDVEMVTPEVKTVKNEGTAEQFQTRSVLVDHLPPSSSNLKPKEDTVVDPNQLILAGQQGEPPKTDSPAPGPSRKSLSGRAPPKLKILNWRADPSTKPSSSKAVQDTLLSESSAATSEDNPLSIETAAADPVRTEEPNFSNCTIFAAGTPYPAASFSFPATSTLTATATSTATSMASTSSSTVIKPENVEPVSILPDMVSDFSTGDNVCTVQSVNDLQNALKSDDDIQIVVPNELLETSEFKTFLSNINSFPAYESVNVGGACVAPPNTPNPSAPPSQIMDSAPQSPQPLPQSPQPCSSRDLSRSGFEEQNSPLPPPPPYGTVRKDDSDDDITLQDLVAMETMEDADVCDEDNFFTLGSSTNPLEPFMNAILQVHDTTNFFSCDKCGLHFGSTPEFRNHTCIGGSKGKKNKGRSKKSTAPSTAVAETNPIKVQLDEDDEVQQGGDDGKWLLPDAVKQEVKAELSIKSEEDSQQSTPLAATGQNWKCSVCKLVFTSGPQLLEHLDLIRRSEHKCAQCHIIFDDRKVALTHRRKFHAITSGGTKVKTEPSIVRDVVPNANGEFVCDKCDRVFKDRELVIKHMSCHDEEKPFECLECGKKFSKSSLLRDHKKRHFEVGAFECMYCQKRFYTPNKLREHVRVHTGEAPLACNVCGKTFRRHSNLSEHKRIHQENRPVKPPKELFCHCGKVFKTQRDLDWHKEGEHEQKPKKCTYCGEVFVHGSSLTRHIRLKHEANFLPANKKTSLYAKCPICSQTFYKTSINKHIRIKHHGQKPFSCDICKSAFVTKCNLENHMWQHKGIRSRPFKCQQCNKAYLRQSLLDAHMRSHRGVKPFVCNECGLQFANKSNWQRHVAEHSGARNYECPHCSKRFSRGYYLTDHLKVHTGEKPYTCAICGKTAATRSNYNSHLRTHITREPVNSEV